MSKPFPNRSREGDDHKVYVGALVPLRLYTLLFEEAEQAGVSRSEVVRRVLADRYGEGKTAVPPTAGNQEQQAKEQDA